ncbi:MAG: HYR domain-containing protein [Blastocatellia bacterium]
MAFLPSRRLLMLILLLTALTSGAIFTSLRTASAALPLVDDTQPNVGAGLPQVGSNAPKSNASSTKAGSVLFFHRYTSSLSALGQVNTLLTITNTNPRDGISARIFMVSNCGVSSRDISLSPNQTRSVLMNDLDPDKSGYAMVTAIDFRGVPAQFNWLIGTAAIRDSLGHEANYNAFSVAKRTGGSVRNAETPASAELKFDNVEYDQLPKNVAIDSIQPQSGPAGTFTDVVLYTPLADMTGNQTQTLDFNGVVYESNGQAHTKTVNGNCGVMKRITEIWPEISGFVTPEKPAWANFAATDTTSLQAAPMLGMTLTDRPGAPRRDARNMQVLQTLPSWKIRVPVPQPESPAADVITSDLAAPTGSATGASENKPGSVLVYSNFASGQFGVSQIRLTNTNKVEKTRVRLFFIGLNPVGDPPAAPLPAEKIITLFPAQSITFEAQDVHPNQRGWVLATAIDTNALPRKFNFLIGSSFVEDATGPAAAYNAIGIAKYTDGSVPRNDDVLTSDLVFNDIDYDRLPASIAFAGIPNQNEVTTLFGFRRPNDNLTSPPNTRGSGSITVYNDLLNALSGVMGANQTNLINVRTGVPLAPITKNIASGHRGWLKLNSASPVLGWYSNLSQSGFNVLGTGNWIGGHSGGGNVFTLTTSATYTLKSISTNPTNSPPTAISETLGVVVEQRRVDGTVVRLDGRGSYDEDPEATLRYAWFVDDKLVATRKAADYKLSRGLHYVKLIVTDEDGIPSAPDEQLVEVRDTVAPIITGMPTNITKTVGSTTPGAFITFDTPLGYDLVDGPVHTTASKNPGSVFNVGRTTVIFTSRDNSGNTATATMTVDVVRNSNGGTFPQIGGKAGNQVPQIQNMFDQYVPPGTTRDLLLQATDPDGDAVSFTVTGLPPFAQVVDVNPIARTAKLRIIATEGAIGSTNVVVRATDAKGASVSTVPFRILVDPVPNDDTGAGGIDPDPGDGGGGGGGGTGGGPTNSPPTARSKPIPAQVKATSKQGAIIALDGSTSSDPDPDDRLTYEWRDGEMVVANGPLAEVTLKPGVHSITLKVTDGRGGLSTTDPQVIEILRRDLTITGVSPTSQRRSLGLTVTITGTGFFEGADGSKISIACNVLCSGGSQITIVGYDLVDEDTIIIRIKSVNAPMGWRDLTVTNPNRQTITLKRAIAITG